MKILIIEDDPDLNWAITKYLSEEKYLCETASSYAQAIEKIDLYSYECIVLDLMLPGGDGMNLLKEIRKQNKEDGIIIISAKGSLENKVEGLKKGADDYLHKPFHLAELAARIQSVIRRKQFAGSNIINLNELSIDLLARTVTVNEKVVLLTKKELDLLLYFLGNRNRVISKNALAEHISGDMADMFDSYDYIYAHIKNLKKKLGDAGCANYIRTVYGSGYKWESV